MKIITILRIIINFLYIFFILFAIRMTYGFNISFIDCNDIFKNSFFILFNNEMKFYWGILVLIILFNYFFEKNVEKRGNYRISNILLITNFTLIFFSILINIIWKFQKCI